MYAAGVAYISVQTPSGGKNIGSAFHIGEGVFITARHIVEGNRILEIATTHRAYRPNKDLPGVIDILHNPSEGKLVKGPFFPPQKNIDVGALVVEGIDAPVIKFWDYAENLSNADLVLQKVLVMGYSPSPLSQKPTLISTMAEVNAVINQNSGVNQNFILSAIARGTFSGGLALTEDECTLGVIAHSSFVSGQLIELGYLGVLSLAQIFPCLYVNRIMPQQMRELWEIEGEDEGM